MAASSATLKSFLEAENAAAVARRRQCEALLLTADGEVRDYLYDLRKKADEEVTIVLTLLGLLR